MDAGALVEEDALAHLGVPRDEVRETYDRAYAAYTTLYPAVAPVMRPLVRPLTGAAS